MHIYIGIGILVFGLLLIGCAASDKPKQSGQGPAHAPPPLVERGDLVPVGGTAPDFALSDQAGRPFRLSAQHGRPVVLIFYPKDFTPGCTKQLCAVRDDWGRFEAKGVVVAGVNPLPVEEHKKFVDHHKFPFPVLSDPDQRVAAAYGCKGASGFPQRTVYGIDAKGIVVFAQRGMPANAEILNATAAK